ncbi:Asp-tRNA(Asn)/Glu-tRNA(Gln) amidotransferase subunit GatA [Candidatus Woesearchaeota archaeon]|nr:Asp-tRNA(Asn)/Glu-tRNA(Gln) amidotransferase subunit GatA [Candidatus Woesearchaeota archaeon]
MSHEKEALEEAKKINEEYHYLNTITDKPLEGHMHQGKLSGYTVSVKDAICVKDVETTGGSAILDGYKPVIDSTVSKKVKSQGGLIIGKTAQDAFGFGGFSVNVGIGKKIPLNPFDKERACGGSSGGCAGFTAKTNLKHVSLAESTGGSIVCPASFCGVVGLCPTYGRVSRYGLLDYGNSLDKIGPMGKNVKDTALLLEVISGFDSKESTCADVEVDEYSSFVGKDVKGMKIALIKECFGKGVNEKVAEQVNQAIEKLKEKGAVIEEVSLPLVSEYGLAVYYILAMCEASTNLAKYCGIRYGKMKDCTGKGFNEYFSEIRSENLNEESKRRIMIGTFARMAGFRDAYYIKAAKIRTKIISEYKEQFEKYDALICPTMPVIAPKFSEIEKMTPLENYMMDILTVGPNLAGLPHITIPTGKVDGMPVGTMLIADHFEEKKLVQLGSALE